MSPTVSGGERTHVGIIASLYNDSISRRQDRRAFGHLKVEGPTTRSLVRPCAMVALTAPARLRGIVWQTADDGRWERVRRLCVGHGAAIVPQTAKGFAFSISVTRKELCEQREDRGVSQRGHSHLEDRAMIATTYHKVQFRYAEASHRYPARMSNERKMRTYSWYTGPSGSPSGRRKAALVLL